MTNVSTVDVAARAAAPPRKTEGVQAPKGEEGFKKCLEACSQEAEPEMDVEAPVEEAVIIAAEAAAILLNLMPVQVETVQPATPETEVEAVKAAPVTAQPVKMEVPVEVNHEAKAETKVETAPAAAPSQAAAVTTEPAAPVKADAKVEVPTFAAALNTAEAKPEPVTGVPVAAKAETAPAAPAPLPQVTTPAAEAAVEEKPVFKVEVGKAVEAEPAVVPGQEIAAKATVSLTAEPAVSRPMVLSQKLGEEIATAAAAGKSSIHIQIQPENMGRIDVRLVSNSDGMQVVLTTDSAATGKLLENNLSQLQKSLSEAGLQVSGLSVNSQGLQGQFSNNPQDQKPANTHRIVNRAAVAAMPVDAIASRYLNQVSGLDFRV